MPDLAKQTIDSEEECFVVEKKKKKKEKKAKYERGYYKGSLFLKMCRKFFFVEMYDREKAEKRVEDQWSSRAKKKVEYHDGIL